MEHNNYMRRVRSACGWILPFVFMAFGLGQPSRVLRPIEKSRAVRLAESVPAKVRLAADGGAVAADFRLEEITLHLKPSAAQQAALEQLVREQQEVGSANYHRWLTPEEWADRFGVSVEDLQRVRAWLEGEGFGIRGEARGRDRIVFGGTAAQVRSAFQTPLRRYVFKGTQHYANTENPAIPEALADVVGGIGGLDDFLPEPDSIQAEATGTNGVHWLAPDDIATIYGVRALYDAGIDGSGQKVAIVGQSAIDLSDLKSYRAKYNLPAMDPQVILYPTSPEPGKTSAMAEANLDLDVVSAVARNAQLIYVYGRNAFTALQYAVDQNLAPVVSASFSAGCEAQNIAAAATLRLTALRANAQGITWLNSSGDAGAAGCDGNRATIAENGRNARFPASIPEITGVGGTQFSDTGGNYWNPTDDANGASAISYIPEAVWNEAIAGKSIAAGGGGKSRFYAKPAWQTGPGVPDDGARGVPDVALASAGHTAYSVINGGQTVRYYGTSGAAPAFAGMMVLMNQYLVSKGVLSKPGLGNVNPVLYGLAQSDPGAFHDVAAGSNAVPCAAGTADCVDGTAGYFAGTGYDLASGLGSVDLGALAAAWGRRALPTASQVEIGLNADPIYELAQADSDGNRWVYTVTVSEQAGVGTTLRDFTIDGVSYANQMVSFFGGTAIAPRGYLRVTLGNKALASPVPMMRTFAFRGIDADGRIWERSLQVKFEGVAPKPAIAAIGNAASYQQTVAPGMLATVYGSNFTTGGSQGAAAVPLATFLSGTSATVNGVQAPLHYVSSGQVNLQIPYETAVGSAQLIINNGLATAGFTFEVVESAPGVFVGGDGMTVPYGGGLRGQVYVLFMTGEGQVTPSLATGSSPAGPPYPKPKLDVTMTIGGADTELLFVGVPPGLVGVTQVNFRVPAGAPLGKQPVVVKVGNAVSGGANFEVRE